MSFENIAEDATVDIYINTTDLTGAHGSPSSPFDADDFSIYKDGGTAQKATANGLTVSAAFDSKTGLHLLSIDTSNDTGDAGFWAAGSSYQVVFDTSKTVDGVSIDGRKVQDGKFGIEYGYLAGIESKIETINSLVDAIKAITDQFVFTIANQVDANALSGGGGGDATLANQSQILSKLLKYFQLALRKDAPIGIDNAVELGEINADEGSGSGAFDNTTEAQEAIRDHGDIAWVPSSGGSGAWTINVHVEDGSGNDLQNAIISFTEGVTKRQLTTDSNGDALGFGLDSADWVLSITKDGYTFTSETVPISADATLPTKNMTPIAITPPASPDQTTAFTKVVNYADVAEAAIPVRFRAIKEDANDGVAVKGEFTTIASGVDGVVQMPMYKGWKYELGFSASEVLLAVEIPASAGSTFELPNMIWTNT